MGTLRRIVGPEGPGRIEDVALVDAYAQVSMIQIQII